MPTKTAPGKGSTPGSNVVAKGNGAKVVWTEEKRAALLRLSLRSGSQNSTHTDPIGSQQGPSPSQSFTVTEGVSLPTVSPTSSDMLKRGESSRKLEEMRSSIVSKMRKAKEAAEKPAEKGDGVQPTPNIVIKSVSPGMRGKTPTFSHSITFSPAHASAVRNAILKKHDTVHQWYQHRFAIAVRHGDHVVEAEVFRNGLKKLGVLEEIADQLVEAVRMPNSSDISITKFIKVVTEGYDESMPNVKQVSVQGYGGVRVIITATPHDDETQNLSTAASRLGVSCASDMQVVTGDGVPVVPFDFENISDGAVYFMQRVRSSLSPPPTESQASPGALPDTDPEPRSEQPPPPIKGHTEQNVFPKVPGPPVEMIADGATQTDENDVLMITDERIIYGERVVEYQHPVMSFGSPFTGSVQRNHSHGRSEGTAVVHYQAETPRFAVASAPSMYNITSPPPTDAFVPIDMSNGFSDVPDAYLNIAPQQIPTLAPTGGLYTTFQQAVSLRHAESNPSMTVGVADLFHSRLAEERLRRGLPSEGATEVSNLYHLRQVPPEPIGSNRVSPSRSYFRQGISVPEESQNRGPEVDLYEPRVLVPTHHEMRGGVNGGNNVQPATPPVFTPLAPRFAVETKAAYPEIPTSIPAGGGGGGGGGVPGGNVVVTQDLVVNRQNMDDPYGARIVGTLIKGVSKRSPADKAGLRAGMKIHSINGAAVRSFEDVEVCGENGVKMKP